VSALVPPALARRDLLRGGALLVGFALLATRGARAQATLPNPDTIDAWIVIHPDNTATLLAGKVELGQGNSTTMLQLAAEELDLSLDQMRLAPVTTGEVPNQGATVSSSSISKAGPQIRKAAAEARQALLRLAAAQLGVKVESLHVTGGVVTAGTGSVTYGALVGGKRFDVAFTGKAPLKPVSAFTVIGTRAPRTDIPEKVAGTYEFMPNQRLPGMLHGRVVRPSQGAYGKPPHVIAIDASSIDALPDVRIVHVGDFVGVVAPREWDAVQAARRLSVQWDRPPALAGNATVFDRMRQERTTDKLVTGKGNVAAAFASPAHMASGTFHGPYQAHASFGPSCAMADVRADSARILCSSQDVYTLRDTMAGMLGLAKDAVRVEYHPAAGCYGHNCFDDAAEAAALMSREVGQPVRVMFMRWDELGWDNYGPAHLSEIRAACDANGKLTAYEYQAWQHGWITTETSAQLAKPGPVQEITPADGVGSTYVNPQNAGAMYDIPNEHVENHHISGQSGYLKSANLRSPLDISTSFGSEQIIDTLARSAGMDPVAFRRANIADTRWRGVLDAVAQAADWQPRTAAPPANGDILTGSGVALGTHRDTKGAAIAEVEVNRHTGAVRVTRIWGAMDCGFAVNPGIVESQVMGMLVQATSRMLKEEVTFSETGVTSLDWVSYPVLRFAECPEVTAIVVQHDNIPASGAGEEVLAAGAAAIANAVVDATGVRMAAYPLTEQRVLAALGVAAKSG
jgi:nicotinate dehydrogenase subunit B